MPLFPREERLSTFEGLGIDWENSNVLDFGGNRGNLLEDLIASDYKFDASNYTSLDVDPEGLELGAKNFPASSWVHYNAGCPIYNPNGVVGHSLPFKRNTFDVSVAYSVHSHSTFESLVWNLTQLSIVTKPGGTIVTTVVDRDLLNLFLFKRLGEYDNVSIPNDFNHLETFLYYINGDVIVPDLSTPVEKTHLVTIYNIDWLKKSLTDKGFNVTIKEKVSVRHQIPLVIKNENF